MSNSFTLPAPAPTQKVSSSSKRVNEHDGPFVWTFTSVMQILGIIMVALAIATVGIYIAVSTNVDGVVRFCVELNTNQVALNNPNSTGEVGNVMRGYIQLDSSANAISYNFYSSPGLSLIQSIHMRGPIGLLSNVGPIAFSLCGFPALYICDVMTTPGLVSNPGLQQVEPGPNDVRPYILAIRDNPSLYYIEVLTANYPASPGALRSTVFSSCGLP